MTIMGKALLAVLFIYVGLAMSAMLGGFIAGFVGAALHWNVAFIRLIALVLRYAIFVGMLLILYVSWRRGRHRPGNES